jgi:hypothetical protein
LRIQSQHPDFTEIVQFKCQGRRRHMTPPCTVFDPSSQNLDLAALQKPANCLGIAARADHVRTNGERRLEGDQRALKIVEIDIYKPASGQRAEMARLKFQCCGDVIERLIEVAHKVVNRSALVPAFGKVRGDRDNPVESFEGGAMIAAAHGINSGLQERSSRLIRCFEPNCPNLRLYRCRLNWCRNLPELGKQFIET